MIKVRFKRNMFLLLHSHDDLRECMAAHPRNIHLIIEGQNHFMQQLYRELDRKYFFFTYYVFVEFYICLICFNRNSENK